MGFDIYKKRRKVLFERNNSQAYVVAAFDAMQQTNDSAAPFIQDASFWYLTGIEEPGWLLIVGYEGGSTLVAPDVAEIHRIFDGGLSDDNAMVISGVDKVVSKKAGKAILSDLLEAGQPIGVISADPHEETFTFTLNPAPKRLFSLVSKNNKQICDIRPILAKMRGIKSPEEIEVIRRAATLTISAFQNIKKSLNTGKKYQYEYEVEADFTYAFRSNGAMHAYQPIVASGINACTLHYQTNNAKLPENGLVLMDVGAKVDGYCADLTRTFAVGMPTERQIQVHGEVEKAHKEIISLLRPGLGIKEYHLKVDEIMKSALTALGLLNEESDYRKYFPHSISHGLGIDVHDPMGAPEVFEPGMVLTVEPGVYIPEEAIGVRIEDNILITKTSHENLTAALTTSL